jgi:hypothetical protein
MRKERRFPYLATAIACGITPVVVAARGGAGINTPTDPDTVADQRARAGGPDDDRRKDPDGARFGLSRTGHCWPLPSGGGRRRLYPGHPSARDSAPAHRLPAARPYRLMRRFAACLNEIGAASIQICRPLVYPL